MTPGARRVLRELAADDDCDIIREGGIVYCGDRRTTLRVVHELLWLLALHVSGETANCAYYAINETGKALLRRPELEAEIQRALATRMPFAIVEDRVLPSPPPNSAEWKRHLQFLG